MCRLSSTPPSESVRNNEPEAFYCYLLEMKASDFNSRVGDDRDYTEEVDEVRPRSILDFTPNANGDLPIDFLIDCGLCMINGCIGMNNYTHVSHRGKSVVDYVFVA